MTLDERVKRLFGDQEGLDLHAAAHPVAEKLVAVSLGRAAPLDGQAFPRLDESRLALFVHGTAGFYDREKS